MTSNTMSGHFGRTNRRTVISLGTLALLITGGMLHAGPIDPPAGPVTSTYKTLTEVEPRTAINAANTPGDADSLYKITQPGSYYLTGNITGVIGKHGIEIAASGVTLDLNGFDLAGVPAMGAFDGVSVTVSGLTNIAVVNGSVRNWGEDGVDLRSGIVSNFRVADLVAADNAGDGIGAGVGGTVTNCSTHRNAGNGILVVHGCTISNCTAYKNTGVGIRTSSGCTISDCTAYVNTASGITTDSAGTVTNCTAYFNTVDGISVGLGTTVANCNASTNTRDGIGCTSNCVIRRNTCERNGRAAGDGAGIHAYTPSNLIEGNSCVGADRGIDVDAAGNIIIGNTCSGNTTDWDIVANNVFGPILDRRAPASAAVLGFSAASTLGSTDPNANYSY